MKTIDLKAITMITVCCFTALSLCFAQNDESVISKSRENVTTEYQGNDSSSTALELALETLPPNEDITVRKRLSKGNQADFVDADDFKNLETYPMPENGMEFGTTIQSMIEYPQDAIDKGVEGIVRVLCTVEPNGDVSNVVVLEDIGYGCANQVCKALRTVKLRPAVQNGFAKKCMLIIPVRFNLD